MRLISPFLGLASLASLAVPLAAKCQQVADPLLQAAPANAEFMIRISLQPPSNQPAIAALMDKLFGKIAGGLKLSDGSWKQMATMALTSQLGGDVAKAFIDGLDPEVLLCTPVVQGINLSPNMGKKKPDFSKLLNDGMLILHSTGASKVFSSISSGATPQWWRGAKYHSGPGGVLVCCYGDYLAIGQSKKAFAPFYHAVVDHLSLPNSSYWATAADSFGSDKLISAFINQKTQKDGLQGAAFSLALTDGGVTLSGVAKGQIGATPDGEIEGPTTAPTSPYMRFFMSGGVKLPDPKQTISLGGSSFSFGLFPKSNDPAKPGLELLAEFNGKDGASSLTSLEKLFGDMFHLGTGKGSVFQPVQAPGADAAVAVPSSFTDQFLQVAKSNQNTSVDLSSVLEGKTLEMAQVGHHVFISTSADLIAAMIKQVASGASEVLPNRGMSLTIDPKQIGMFMRSIWKGKTAPFGMDEDTMALLEQCERPISLTLKQIKDSIAFSLDIPIQAKTVMGMLDK